MIVCGYFLPCFFQTMSGLIVLIVVCTPCLCAGANVELASSASSIIEGESLTLTCSVRVDDVFGATFFHEDKGKYLGYVKLVEGRCEDAKSDICNRQCSCSGDGRGFSLTISNLDRSMDGRGFLCGVKSPNATTYSSVRRISVLYPPNKSTTLSPSGLYNVLTGTTVTLDCQVKGGNPLATLSWQCKGSPMTGQNRTKAGKSWSTLEFTIEESYHRRQCVCTARHQASPNGVFGTKTIEFNVIYPPKENITLFPSGTYSVFTGTTVTLICQVKGGNPMATLSWQCKGSPRTGRDQTKADKLRSRLVLKMNESYHRGQCVCTARHQASPQGVFGTEIVEFNVIYGPVIALDHSLVYVRESNEFKRTCSAQGNPTPITYWKHNGKSVMTKNIHFQGIDRQDAGNYTCIATATQGNISLQSAKTLDVIVQYGPDVDISIPNATENAANHRLNCSANGVPTQYTYKWIHKIGPTVIRDTFDHVTNFGSFSTLIIQNVSLQDMGTYICEVKNGIPGRDGQIVQTDKGSMFVSASPRVISGREVHVTKKGVSLNINVTFISFPDPDNTSILRTDSYLPPEGDPTVSVSPVPVSVSFYNKDVIVDGYMAQIQFSNIETEHTGCYHLYIRNLYEYFYNFIIVISDKPDPPTRLRIGQITENSASISWIPGEDNGHIQVFTLSHRKSSGGLQTNVTLNHTFSAYTIEDLTESTEYHVILHASNDKGTSEPITGAFTTKSASISMKSAAIIAGAAGSAAVFIVIVLVVVVRIRRRRRRVPRRKPTEDRSGDDDYEMKENVLYGSNWSPQPGPSHQEQSGGAVYAAVRKPKSRPVATETREYAEANTTNAPINESAAYAEVQKPRKGKTQKEPAKDMSADNIDGMKVNILYESAGPNWFPEPGSSNQVQLGGPVYAAVRKPRLTSNILDTLEVNTAKKPEDKSAVYAEIQKPGK